MSADRDSMEPNLTPGQVPMPWHGSFLVYGDDREPAVIYLSAAQLKQFYDRQSSRDRSYAIKHAFGAGYSHAVPAWCRESLEPLAEGYFGPWKDRIRAMACCMILGIPLQELALSNAAAIQLPQKKDKAAGNSKLVAPVPVQPSPAGRIQP